MNILPQRLTRARKTPSVYWTPPVAVTIAEVHPFLTTELLLRDDGNRYSVLSASVFDMISGGPRGTFDVAVDPSQSRICGYFDKGNTDRPMPRPIWFAASASGEVMEAFYEALREHDYVS